MKEINPREQDHEGINIQRVFWAAIIYTVVALASVGLAIFLITRFPIWQVFMMAATTVVSLGLDLTALILVRRGRPASALKILYWSGLFTVPLNSLLFIKSNITPILAAIVIVIGFVNVFYLFPTSWRKLYPFGPVVVAALMLVVDFIDPPFRMDLGGVSVIFGPLVLVFLIISIAILVVRQAWAGNYRAKLTTLTTMITLLASGTVAFFIVRASTQALTQSIGTLLKTDAEARAIQLGDLLNRQIEVLSTLSLNEILQAGIQASNTTYTGDASSIQAELDSLDQQWRAADAADNNDDPLVSDRMNNELSSVLLGFQSSFPAHAEVFLTDRHGALVATTNRTSDYYQADEGWWQNAYKSGLGAVYISTPEFDESVGEFSLLIALPIRNRDTSQILGILRTTYLLTALQELLEFTKIGATGEADIIFPGETTQHIHEGELEPVEPQEWEQLQALSGVAYAEMNIEGAPSLVSQAQVKTVAGDPAIDDLGWLVTVHQGSEEALAPVTAQTRNAVILGVIIALVASAAAIGLAQVLVTPILRLTATAQQVAGGDLTARATVETADEVGTLANTFNSMTAQLGDLIGTLEQRVVARTRALETSAEVSRRLSTILDQRQLVREVVGQLQAAFGYYHAHIYLFDETKENLVMVGGTGEAGQTMIARGHRLPKGRGLVGRTAEENAPVLVTDTSQDSDWLPNPLLPETRSELAVPIAIGDNVLGVLDVQHNVARGLSQEDTDLIQSIANQVAIAVQNAQAYTQAQRQADREALIGNISRRIQNATTIEDVLKVAVSELGRALGAQRSGVELNVEALSSDERN